MDLGFCHGFPWSSPNFNINTNTYWYITLIFIPILYKFQYTLVLNPLGISIQLVVLYQYTFIPILYIIHVNRIFPFKHHKPTILGIPHGYGTPLFFTRWSPDAPPLRLCQPLGKALPFASTSELWRPAGHRFFGDQWWWFYGDEWSFEWDLVVTFCGDFLMGISMKFIKISWWFHRDRWLSHVFEWSNNGMYSGLEWLGGTIMSVEV